MEDKRAHTHVENSSAPGSDGGVRPALAVGSLLAVLASAAGSIVAYGLVPSRLRIHWTLGAGPHYGPEFAPAVLVLTAFPVLVAALALGANWMESRFRNEEFVPARPYDTAAVLGTLAVLLASQAAVVLANLG